MFHLYSQYLICDISLAGGRPIFLTDLAAEVTEVEEVSISSEYSQAHILICVKDRQTDEALLALCFLFKIPTVRAVSPSDRSHCT